MAAGRASIPSPNYKIAPTIDLLRATHCNKRERGGAIETEIPAVTKQTEKLRKRLHHEFRNLVGDEWSTCRQSQNQAMSKVHEILSNGAISQAKPDVKIEDWEVLQNCEEALKQPKSTRASASFSSMISTINSTAAATASKDRKKSARKNGSKSISRKIVGDL